MGENEFTVTEERGKISFGGSITGNVTIHIDGGGTASFTRGGITAETLVANITAKAVAPTDEIDIRCIRSRCRRPGTVRSAPCVEEALPV